LTADKGFEFGQIQFNNYQKVSEVSGLIKILKDPHEILQLGGQMLDSSGKEILITVSSANTFLRQSKSGILHKLFNMLDNGKTGVDTIRILTPVNDLVFNVLEGLHKKYSSIQVKTIEELEPQIQVTILIVDRKSCLVIELKDDSKPVPEEAMGTATYSTSGPTVMSYFTIFETLWKQSELYAKLQAHEAAQREFFNLVAHELRTPIQPTLGLSESILMKDKNIDLNHYHTVILRNARRLQTLAENILDVTKIEANNISLKKESVELHSLISEVIEDFKGRIADDSQVMKQGEGGEDEQRIFVLLQKDVKILLCPEVNIEYSGQQQQENHDRGINETEKVVSPHIASSSPPPLMILIDRNRIVQVLNNLISNALWSVTYGSDGNKELKIDGDKGEDGNERYIEVSTQIDSLHNRVIVTVKDNGEGISQDVFPKLFTKFATKNDRGLGLGLYICRGIVEAHGGTIWAENKQVDKMNVSGAAFRFSLPIGGAQK
jgi:two-component system sensor histidine kinase VicK